MDVDYRTTHGEGRVTNHILEVSDAPPIIHDVVEAHLGAVRLHVLALCGLYEMSHDLESRVGTLERAESVNATIEERLDAAETKQVNDRGQLGELLQLALELSEDVRGFSERLYVVETKQRNDRERIADLEGKPVGMGKTLGEIADDVGAQDAFVNRTIAEHLERTEQGDDLLATIGDLNVAFHNFGVKTKGRFYSSEQIQAARNAFWRSLDDSRYDES